MVFPKWASSNYISSFGCKRNNTKKRSAIFHPLRNGSPRQNRKSDQQKRLELQNSGLTWSPTRCPMVSKTSCASTWNKTSVTKRQRLRTRSDRRKPDLGPAKDGGFKDALQQVHGETAAGLKLEVALSFKKITRKNSENSEINVYWVYWLLVWFAIWKIWLPIGWKKNIYIYIYI